MYPSSKISNNLKKIITKNKKNHRIKNSQSKTLFIEKKRIYKMKYLTIRRLNKSNIIPNNKTNNSNSNT